MGAGKRVSRIEDEPKAFAVGDILQASNVAALAPEVDAENGGCPRSDFSLYVRGVEVVIFRSDVGEHGGQVSKGDSGLREVGNCAYKILQRFAVM